MSDKPEWMKALAKKKKLKKSKQQKYVSTEAKLGSEIKSGKKLKKSKQQKYVSTEAKLGTEIKSGTKLKKTKTKKKTGYEAAAAQYRKTHGDGKSFTEMLDEKSLEYFNEVCTRVYAEQAQFFLNAFWDEFGDQAEVIYRVLWNTIKKVEMESQGINYLHLYEEGFDLDFDMGLLLFERLVQYFGSSEGKADKKEYPEAVPSHMTAIKRKKELRDKVDVNFDGRVGFLEFLLYQFKASPKTLMERSTRKDESNPELDAARAALAEVNKRIKAFEAEKARLQKIIDTKTGVKKNTALHTLAGIESGPLMEDLRAALITAEAKVRIVAKRTKTKISSLSGSGNGDEPAGQPRNDGTIWWMKREIKEKKRLYGRKKRS